MPRWPSNFALGVKTKFKGVSEENIKKKLLGLVDFPQGIKVKIMFEIQNPKLKGNILPSNFDGQLPNIYLHVFVFV